MARVASQRFVFTKSDMFVFFRPYCHFSTICRVKKHAHWNFAKIWQIFSPWTPIWHHYVHFWMMSVPENNPGLKLKSEILGLLRIVTMFKDYRTSNYRLQLFRFEKLWKHVKMVERNTKLSFSVKRMFEKLHGPYQSCKKSSLFDII